jgi:drug/metabolite transporter (DMT)-like permease
LLDATDHPLVVGATPDVASPDRTASAAAARRRVGELIARPGILDALLSGVGFGLFFVFIARTSEAAGHWPLLTGRMVSVVMFAVGAMLTKGALLPERGSRRVVVLAGLLDAAAAVCFLLSTRSGLLSVGAVLASLYPVVTILLARFITQERISRRQVVGLVLAGLAVSLLAL